MLVGHPPFVAENQMETYHKIMRGKYKIPQNFPRHAKDIISKLLTYNPAGRLGCWKDGTKDVVCHEFFKSMNWQKLEAKQFLNMSAFKLDRVLEMDPEFLNTDGEHMFAHGLCFFGRFS